MYLRSFGLFFFLFLLQEVFGVLNDVLKGVRRPLELLKERVVVERLNRGARGLELHLRVPWTDRKGRWVGGEGARVGEVMRRGNGRWE